MERSGWLEIGPGAWKGPVDLALAYNYLFKETSGGALGTGPFVLEEGDAHHLFLRRVLPAPGRIARVEIVTYPTARDAFARALRGEADAVFSLDERQLELIEGVPRFQVVRQRAPHALAVVVNASRLDRTERLELLRGLPVGDVAAAYGRGCQYDAPEPEPARPAGRALEVLTPEIDPGLERAALALRRALGARGGALVREENTRVLQRLIVHDFDLAVTYAMTWPPSILARYWRTGVEWNWAAYSNARFDAAVDARDFEAAMKELQRDPPVVYLCRRERVAAVDARIKNPTLGIWGLLETLPDWEVE